MNQKERKIKAAVIGLGPHGLRVMDALRRIPEIELQAIVDWRGENFDSDKLQPSVERYKSAEDLWRRGGIDLACVTTNGPSHASLAIAAMDAGARYVMIEKPMACSIAECEQMVEKAHQTGVRLAVDHPRRHAPMYRWIRDSIRTGEWGEPRSIWVQRPGIGLGCLGTHSFDLARFLTGAEVNRVTAWVDQPCGPNQRGEGFIDPGGLVILEMDNKLRAVISQIEDASGPMSVEINLTDARIRVDEKSGSIEIFVRDRSVAKKPDHAEKFDIQRHPEGLNTKRDLRSEVTSILQELITDRPMEADGKHGLVSIEILVAAYLSHQRGNIPVSMSCLSAEARKVWLPIT